MNIYFSRYYKEIKYFQILVQNVQSVNVTRSEGIPSCAWPNSNTIRFIACGSPYKLLVYLSTDLVYMGLNARPKIGHRMCSLHISTQFPVLSGTFPLQSAYILRGCFLRFQKICFFDIQNENTGNTKNNHHQSPQSIFKLLSKSKNETRSPDQTQE